MVWLRQGKPLDHYSHIITKESPRYATPAPTVQAPAQLRGHPPAQRPIQAHPQATARPDAILVQSPGPAQANSQAVAASVQNRAQFIPGPPAAVASVAAFVPGPAQIISHPRQADAVPSEIESLKIRLDQAESAKKALEKQLDEKDGALKLAQKTQIDMAKMLGERKGEMDNAKWQIEDLEMAKAELEKELAKKKLATASDEGRVAQAASDKKALEDMMREKEESARRVENELANGEARVKSAEARATAAERQLTEAKGQVQTLATELSSQKKLYSEAKNEASHLRGDLNSLTATVDEMEASNRARTTQIATLQQEKQTMTAEMTKLTKRFNDALHAANAAKKEIEDQKRAVAIEFIASTETIAVVAQEQVKEAKSEEQEPIPVTISQADYRAERKTSSLQRWVARLVVILTLIAILKPVLTAPAVKMFFENHALTDNFFQQEQNQSVAKNESSWTFLPRPEATPEFTATPNDSHCSGTVEDSGTVPGNTTSPAQPTPGDTAPELTSLNRIINWATENPYKVAGWVTVCFSGGAAYYNYQHSARSQ